jgi:hypothetical protein
VSPEPSARFGHPLGGPELRTLETIVVGEYLDVELPPFDTWGLLVVDR